MIRNWKFKFSIHSLSGKGFTLIELLVVIAIIGIMGGFGVKAMMDYNKSQALQIAANSKLK